MKNKKDYKFQIYETKTCNWWEKYSTRENIRNIKRIKTSIIKWNAIKYLNY